METARTLIRCYLEERRIDLCFQGIEEELAGLPGAYGPPRGALFIAERRAVDDADKPHPVGIVALRALPSIGPGVCEMKRLYVAPAARGTGLGRRLVETIIEAARRCGYRTMKLDTLARLKAANALYARCGFRPCPRYNDNPYPDVLYFARDL
ncbi:MAG: GNAT family N-acetyltransferase [Alphaproteobacteria bacterium]|nr:MAG: GNAT family N-acetyltransferase [Alphaproteobacteria bacterium]